MSEQQGNFSRRTYMKGITAAGTAGLAGLAGCLGGGGGGGNNSSGGGNQQLEVLHGWTGGDGAEALDALIQGFEEAHPDVNANFQAIGGGGNTNLDTTISNRAQNGNLPSTWADWPGLNLIPFTSAELLTDIGGDVWTDDMQNNYAAEPQTYSQVGAEPGSVGNGPYVAVPLGSHRMNDLFYNVSVVESAGVDPASLSTPQDLVGAFQQVQQNTDAVPFAQGLQAPFNTLQLWEVVMQGQAGYQAYMDFLDGNGDPNAVRSAFETVQQLQQYNNDDASSIDFTEANQLIMNGNAAFMHNGNWVAGAYRNQDGFNYGDSWNHVTFPGTDGLYGMHLDSFPMPADGPAADAARTFLSYVGTVDAQVAFNPLKGSIPPRTDAPTDQFGPYLTNTIEDYNSASNKPPTIAHGLGATPEVHTAIDEVITNDFLGSGNLQATTQGMLDAVSGSN
jgi:glucose/mannose transport system substrate-binding protein